MKSQKQRILEYLQRNKTISSLECVMNLKIIDLQHSIMELRREGYKITDEWKKKSYDKGYYKVYKLED